MHECALAQASSLLTLDILAVKAFSYNNTGPLLFVVGSMSLWAPLMLSSSTQISLNFPQTSSLTNMADTILSQDLPVAWEPSEHDIDTKAWRYAGYRSFSRFVSSDKDFYMLRRFGALSARVLLDLQDQLTVLEEDLERLDQHHRQKDVPDLHNGSFREETQTKRKRLVSKAKGVLREYSKHFSVSLFANYFISGSFASIITCRTETFVDDLVLQHSQLRARPKVPSKEILSVKNGFHNSPNAILEAETRYITQSSDLFSLVPAAKTPLRRLLERYRQFRLLRLWRQDPSDSVMKDEHVHYISDARVDHFVTVFIMSFGLTMLITPLWILAFVGGVVQRLGVISAFIVLFVTLLLCYL